MMPTRWNFTPHVFYVFVKNSRRVQMPEFFSRLWTWVPTIQLPHPMLHPMPPGCPPFSRMFAVTDMHLQVGNQVPSLWIFLVVSFLTCRWICKLTYNYGMFWPMCIWFTDFVMWWTKAASFFLSPDLPELLAPIWGSFSRKLSICGRCIAERTCYCRWCEHVLWRGGLGPSPQHHRWCSVPKTWKVQVQIQDDHTIAYMGVPFPVPELVPIFDMHQIRYNMLQDCVTGRFWDCFFVFTLGGKVYKVLVFT